APAGPAAGPSRPPGEPAPTVAVSYRVIRRPAATTAGSAPSQAHGSERQGTAGATGGGADGWDSLPGEDW
ncbi:MAG: hypothetical protein WBN89_09360, partial [Prochlorococcaceae cyanobacterium]